MANITNPHDKFFRGTMHDITVARGFLELYMVDEDRAPLDLSTLEIQNTTQIDKNLSESISDLVYSCQYKDKSLGESRVIVLVEHQSTPQKLMPFRIYHYLFNLLNNELKKDNSIEKLPAVCALVFYHGELTPYPYSMKLQDCFIDPAGIMQRFWQTPVPLIDVNTFGDDELLDQHIQGFMSIALKHGRDKEIGEVLLKIIHGLLAVDFDDDFRLQFTESVAAYLHAVGKITNQSKFKKDLAKLPKPIRGKVMTYAEQMKTEGKEEVAINLLKLNLKASVIAESTGLSLERIAQLKQEYGL